MSLVILWCMVIYLERILDICREIRVCVYVFGSIICIVRVYIGIM